MNRRYSYFILIFAFLLGCRDGFVALWKIPEPEPVYIFPYSTASVPPADRQRLETGIRVESARELMALLEDYLS